MRDQSLVLSILYLPLKPISDKHLARIHARGAVMSTFETNTGDTFLGFSSNRKDKSSAVSMKFWMYVHSHSFVYEMSDQVGKRYTFVSGITRQ